MWGEEPLPNLEDLPFRRAKAIVKCISARQFAGPRTIGQLLLPKDKGHRQTISAGQLLSPPKLIEVTSLFELDSIH